MCIYDDTLFDCGASLRHLVQQCPYSNTCLPHIRSTEYQFQSCSECTPTRQEATGLIWGAESIWTLFPNSCGESGYLRNYSQAMTQDEALQEFEEFVNEDDCQPPSQEQIPKAEDDESSEMKTPASRRVGAEPMSLSERLAQPSTVFEEGWTEDEENRGDELDDEDRKLLAEIVPDDSGSEDEDAEGKREEGKDGVSASVQSHSLMSESEQTSCLYEEGQRLI